MSYYLQDLATGFRVRLSRGRPLIVGRGSDCHVQVRDPLASRRHCEVFLDPLGRVLVSDHSRNGTHVGRRNVIHLHPVQPGEVLRVGGARLMLVSEATPSLPARIVETLGLRAG